MSVESKVQSLITSVNTITGESRTDLTACVQDLADGYEQGVGVTIALTRFNRSTYNPNLLYVNNNDGIILSNGVDNNKNNYGWLCDNEGYDKAIDMGIATQSFRIIARVLRKTKTPSGNWGNYWRFNTGTQPFIYSEENTQTVSFTGGAPYLNFAYTLNTWYYYVVSWSATTGKVYSIVYDDNGNEISKATANKSSWSSLGNATVTIGGSASGGNGEILENGLIDIGQFCIEIDGVIQWGNLNSKTENMGLEII